MPTAECRDQVSVRGLDAIYIRHLVVSNRSEETMANNAIPETSGTFQMTEFDEKTNTRVALNGGRPYASFQSVKWIKGAGWRIQYNNMGEVEFESYARMFTAENIETARKAFASANLQKSAPKEADIKASLKAQLRNEVITDILSDPVALAAIVAAAKAKPKPVKATP